MQPEASRPPDSLPVTFWDSARRRWVVGLAVGLAILLIMAGAGLWARNHWGHSDSRQTSPADAPPDPRLSYAGPFKNIHPSVRYVGDAECDRCHKKESESFHRHPMGRSLLPISAVAAAQSYDAKAHNPFESLGARFEIERQGDRVIHRRTVLDEKGETIYQHEIPVDYVLGSGSHGCSYLTDREGFLFQTPISWYSQKEIWALSPGFHAEILAGRPIGADCFFCHANRAYGLEGYINRYAQPPFEGYAIGCERCHGPGERHVKDPGNKDPATGVDYTIVNPRHLEPSLRAAVCEQCHLAGDYRVTRRGRESYDFRPGMPLDHFWSVFVRETEPDQPRKAVNHVEQMYLSECFLRSKDYPARGERKLGCTSCHDPHQQVEAKDSVIYYRQRCLVCHDKRPCSVPEGTRRRESPDDSCIQCHMPKYASADIAHNASTDHRILRQREKETPANARLSPDAASQRMHVPRLRSFYPTRATTGNKEEERDKGVALVRFMIQSMSQRKPVPPGLPEQAVELLESAMRNDPDDLQALAARGMGLTLLDPGPKALAACEDVLSKDPHREISLMGAALVAEKLKQPDLAVSYWRRAAEENPWQPYYRLKLAPLLVDQHAWSEARSHCEAALRLDPGNLEARALWVRSLIRTGEKARAEEEFRKIERLKPANLPILRAHFAAEMHAR